MSPNRIKSVSVLIVSLFLTGHSFAADTGTSNKESLKKIRVEDKMISATFKTLAKAFVSTQDINKLINNGTEKIKKKDEEKFKKQYAKIYKIISAYPDFAASYGMTQDMTKEQVIEKMKSLENKSKIYSLINAVPDDLIAEQFREYINAKRQEIQKSNIVLQINQLWNKILGKM